ncbi:MAG TPA: hypothetical protein VFW87_02805 [Pirellulales bacterium]|nr:hypothetical protein [Pirellulales bacterium]
MNTASYTTAGRAEQGERPKRAARRGPVLLTGYAAITLLLAATFWGKFQAQGLPNIAHEPWVRTVLAAALLLALAGWLAISCSINRVTNAIGVEGLAIIGLFAGAHFAVTFGSMIAGGAVYALLGPFSAFITGVADVGIPALLMAALVVLIPRPGTLMLAYLAQFLLMCLFGGSFDVFQLVPVTVSIVLGEGALAIAGATTSNLLRQPGGKPPRGAVARTALAIALAKAAAVVVQYAIYMVFYRLYYATGYIVAIALIPYFGYGGIGAALGVKLGYRLRRVAR